MQLNLDERTPSASYSPRGAQFEPSWTKFWDVAVLLHLQTAPGVEGYVSAATARGKRRGAPYLVAHPIGGREPQH